MIQKSEQFKTNAEGVFVSTGLIVEGNSPTGAWNSVCNFDFVDANSGAMRRGWFRTSDKASDGKPLAEGIEGWADVLPAPIL